MMGRTSGDGVAAHRILADHVHDDRFEAFIAEPAIGRATADEDSRVAGDPKHHLDPRVDQRLEQLAEPGHVDPAGDVEPQAARKRHRDDPCSGGRQRDIRYASGDLDQGDFARFRQPLPPH
jgi:hypothetical protein